MTEKKLETSTAKEPKRKFRHWWWLVGALVIVLGLYVASEQRNRTTTKELEEARGQIEELRRAAAENPEAQAEEVLRRVGGLIDLPQEPRPSVIRIDDINQLRATNDFFNAAENGDYLILTDTRAILFDPDRGIVLDVAPYQINAASPSPGTARPTSTVSQ